MHGAEEGADVAAIVFVGKLGGRVIDASVGPAVIGRKHHEMLFHGEGVVHRRHVFVLSDREPDLSARRLSMPFS